MGYEWLNLVVRILTDAGFRAGEEYPAKGFPEIAEPVAAVGLMGLNCAQGEATVKVGVISPRKLGGWACQNAAAEAVAALEAEGIRCQMGGMEYLARIDCYQVEIHAVIRIDGSGEDLSAGKGWKVFQGSQQMLWVKEFTTVQEQNRRLIGATAQAEPVGVTPGKGGWTVRLVQQIPPGEAEPEDQSEPFKLMAMQEGWTHTYNDCYWDRVKRSYSDSGLLLERQGYAMRREVARLG